MKEITDDKGRVRPVVEGDFQCDENGNSTRFYEILSIIGYVKDDGTKIGYISKTDVPIGIPITDTNYWYPFQVIAVPKGDKGDKGDDGKSAYELYIEHGGTIVPEEAWIASLQGKDGKDGQPLMLRVTPDGQSLEISDDSGHTWYMFEKNFSKLRVLGYLNSVSELPRNADIGDIYGVKLPNEEVEPGHSAYDLWINTVKGWNEDYVITKIYDYDTELPSYAAEGSTVVVPVKYLTLDKQKVDGYKVYSFDKAKNGWTMILNTAEIFASKEDIVNHGDNVYALVQGDSKKTYHDITNWINGSLDENNKYQEDLTNIIGTCPIDGSVRELSYNIANGYKADVRILTDEQLDPVNINDPTIVYDTEVVEGTGSIIIPSNAKSIIVTMKSVNEEEEIPTSAGTMVSMYSVKEEKIILYKRDTDWVYFGTNASITYIPVQDVEEGTSTNILSGEAVKLKFAEFAAALDAFKQEIKDTYGNYEENPEFVRVTLDNNNKVLYGVQANGNFYFGAGCPQQVKNYIEERIKDFSPDEYKAIVSFLNNLEFGDKTLQELLNEKVDKEEGKSLIDEEYAEGVDYIGNPEFVEVKFDQDSKILEAISIDGTKLLPAGVDINDKIDFEGNEITIIKNPEFVYVKTDREGKILWAIKIDGSIYYGVGVPPQIIDYINKKIADLSLDEYEDIVSFLADLEKGDETLQDLLDKKVDGEYVENSEFIEVTTDLEGKVLAGRTPDGAAFENVGLSTPIVNAPKVSINGHTLENIEDPEGRSEITIDFEGKIISYRDADGLKHENVGIESNTISLSEEGLKAFQENLNTVPINKKWYLPKFGKINIKEETFYLTADSRWSTKDDVICIQMHDDTNENASQKLTLSYYYIKSTLTPLAGGGYDRTSVNENSVRLNFYIAKDIKEVSGSYYVKSTLVDGQVVPESIEVTQVKDVPPYKAWIVNKNQEHYCLADIDFGEFYLKKNVPISIKYQGNSTMGNRKRGFRITFYKNNNYAQKDKVKIGEMVRLSGYNMKSYFYDSSRIKDPFISNVVIEMLDSRSKEAYPWNADSVPFSGATGTIKSFPIETWFGDEFFGLQFFGLKKDERNYMLNGDDDSSGIFAQGYGYGMFTNMSVRNWEDQMAVDGREKAFPDMEDSVSVETAAAIEKLLKATKGLVDGTIEINGQVVNFDISMLEEHIDVENWIDYWIVCEVFQLWDSTSNNMIIHTRRDKKKFYGFFYDLDQSFGLATDKSIIEVIGSDGDFWDKFRKEYKDSIINRYYLLRKSILSEHNLDSLYHTIVNSIPSDTISKEVERWGNGNPASFVDMLSKLKERLVWLDETYFNLK